MDHHACALRTAVAARALNLLPSQISRDTATSLASCGVPRVVPHHAISPLVILTLVIAGAVIGWALCLYQR